MSKRIDFGPVLPIHRGEWKANTVYERLNTVRHNSASWVCKVASTTVEPSATSTDWFLQTEDSVSVASVNGQTGVVEITNTLTTPAIDDDSTLIANTAWVTDKIEQVVTNVDTLVSTTASNTLTQANTNTATVVANAINQITAASDSKFTTKTELDVVRANTVDVVKDQTIDGTKTFNSPIKGSITGNAATATKATQDGNGDVITATYLSKVDASNNYLGKNAKAVSATTADSAIKASQDASGNTITTTYATKDALASVSAVADAALPANRVTYGTEDLEAGVSPLPTGTLYFVYEE